MRKFPLASISFLSAIGVLGAFAQAAYAQAQTVETRFLSWEHTLTTRASTSKHALAKLKIYNNWTPGKHRLLVKYNVAGLGAADDFIGRNYGSSFSMPTFDASRISEKAAYHNGTLGLVTNLDADKLLAYSSESGEHGEYFIENRKALMKRLRFDPWKKIAPELSKSDVPKLSAEQRNRLGAEVRAALRPALKRVLKTYFRPVKQSRIFNVAGEKIEARGFRLTVLMNAGGYGSNEEWVRTAFEWWLAPEMEGDGIERGFLGKVLRDHRELGGPTTSMWMNETLPLMWASMPKEFHSALATLLPQALSGDVAQDGSTPIMTGGTPVYAAATVIQSKPRLGRCPDCGQYHVPLGGAKQSESIRLELQLKNRSTRALSPAIFDAPAEYKKEPLEPLLKEWDDRVKLFQGMYDENTLLSQAPVETGSGHRAPAQYSWRALKDYNRKASALMFNAR